VRAYGDGGWIAARVAFTRVLVVKVGSQQSDACTSDGISSLPMASQSCCRPVAVDFVHFVGSGFCGSAGDEVLTACHQSRTRAYGL
jgi:hypothetical protein